MSVANPPVWADPTAGTVDIQSGAWTSAAIDGICSDLAVLGGTDGATGIAQARNLLVNGGFEVWQRGTTGFGATSAYTADRWQIQLAGTSTVTVARESSNIAAGSQYALSAVYVHNASSYLTQSLEMYPQLQAVALSLGVWVKCATANAVRVAVADSSSNTYSAYHPGDNLYHLLTVPAVVIGATATTVQVQLRLDASCTAFFDSAMLVAGKSVAPFVPLSPADDVLRCQRYYERLIDHADGSWSPPNLNAAGAQAYGFYLAYKVRKALSPTLNIVGTWAVGNCAQPTVVGNGTSGCFVQAVASASGNMSFSSQSGCYVEAVANP